MSKILISLALTLAVFGVGYFAGISRDNDAKLQVVADNAKESQITAARETSESVDLAKETGGDEVKEKIIYREVIKYVEAKIDDPMCFGDGGLRLLNSGLSEETPPYTSELLRTLYTPRKL